MPGWTIQNTWFDMMHNMPYGVGKDLAANIICEVAEVKWRLPEVLPTFISLVAAVCINQHWLFMCLTFRF
jgi:hypothetical protein